jgi:hypothetical protein
MGVEDFNLDVDNSSFGDGLKPQSQTEIGRLMGGHPAKAFASIVIITIAQVILTCACWSSVDASGFFSRLIQAFFTAAITIFFTVFVGMFIVVYIYTWINIFLWRLPR